MLRYGGFRRRLSVNYGDISLVNLVGFMLYVCLFGHRQEKRFNA